jgi:hypothetical protein
MIMRQDYDPWNPLIRFAPKSPEGDLHYLSYSGVLKATTVEVPFQSQMSILSESLCYYLQWLASHPLFHQGCIPTDVRYINTTII